MVGCQLVMGRRERMALTGPREEGRTGGPPANIEIDPLTPEERRLARGLWQAVILAVIMFASLGCYLLVLKWRGPAGEASVTHTEWDDAFPFRPGWVWVYLFPYLIGPGLVGMLSRDTFAWYV